MSLTVLFLLGPLFFLLVCFVQPWCDDFYLVLLFCLVLSCLVVVSWRTDLS